MLVCAPPLVSLEGGGHGREREGLLGKGLTHANGLEDVDETGKVGDAVVEDLNGGLEEVEGCAEGGDAVGVGCGVVGGHGHDDEISWVRGPVYATPGAQ